VDILRNWHFCWSSLYFKHKHGTTIGFIIFFIRNIAKYFLKTLLNSLILKRKKTVLNFIRLRACINYLFIKKSSFRVEI
jgi:N-acetylglucosaminyl-diphospho-decaprenol L-rhamnosyltransferase